MTQADLEESVEVVIAGYQKKNAVLSDKEKKIVAYHEIGHALVAALQNHSAPVHKITIIPRTSGALGYTMQVEEGEQVPDEPERKSRTRSPPSPAAARPRSWSSALSHHRRLQRYRAGHQAGPRHDHPLRHERGV